jgi:hypothetical protein
MNYSICVLDETRLSGDKDFWFRQIHRHFQTWENQIIGSSFVLCWLGHHLILTTNSQELLTIWQQVECEYVEKVLSAKPFIEDDMNDLVCYPAA